MGSVIGIVLGVVALAVDVLGPAPGGPGLVLGLAALVSAPRTTGTLASLLGLTAVGVALGDGSAALLTPLGWLAHVTLGLAMGAVARHADGPTVMMCHERPVTMGLVLTAAAAFVGLLPDGLLQLMAADGTPLHLGVALSEPALATQMAVSVPARLMMPAPMSWALAWLPSLSGVAAIALALGGLLGTARGHRLALASVALLALALVVPALADLSQLAAGGPVALPSAEQLVVELGWTSGGVTGLSLHDRPESGYLTLASRPVVSVLRLVVGLALVHWLWTQRVGCTVSSGASVSLAWCWAGVVCGLVAWVGFMAFVSAARVDPLAPWGAEPVAWTVAGGAVIAAAAGFGALFGARAARWATGLELLALGIWCCGVVAPTAGWLAQ